MGKEELFDLTHKQMLAFNRFKKAHDDCVREGIKLFNNYGHIYAVDSSKISSYNDRPSEYGIDGISDDGQCINSFELSCSEWADDPHWFHPAPGAIESQ